jgi:hypothetical protein
MMMMIIGLFGQLRLEVSSQGCEMSKQTTATIGIPGSARQMKEEISSGL